MHALFYWTLFRFHICCFKKVPAPVFTFRHAETFLFSCPFNSMLQGYMSQNCFPEKCWFFLPFSRLFSESEVRNARPSRVGVSASAVRRTRKHSAAAGVSKSIPRINWETAFSQLNSVKVWKNLKKCWAMGDTILFWRGVSYFLFSRANCLKW